MTGTPIGGGHHHHGRPWTREQALAVLEAPERNVTQSPDVLWSKVPLSAGLTVADVGTGTGYYAIPAARLVGKNGRVYAIDLSTDLVGLVAERAKREHLSQLTPVHSSLTKIPIATAAADVVLLANVLHDLPPRTIAEAVRLLRPGGRFANVDWKKESTPGGPPLEIRMTPEVATRLLARYGLSVLEEWELGPYHYGLTLRREGLA